MTRERFEELAVKVVDEVATPAEREELMAWVVEHPDSRRELEAHRALKAATDGWVARLTHDLVHDRHEARASTGAERVTGVALFVIGTAVLLAGGAVELFVDPEVPLWARIGVGGLVGGSLLLLISAVRWRLATHRDDPYREVIR